MTHDEVVALAKQDGPTLPSLAEPRVCCGEDTMQGHHQAPLCCRARCHPSRPCQPGAAKRALKRPASSLQVVGKPAQAPVSIVRRRTGDKLEAYIMLEKRFCEADTGQRPQVDLLAAWAGSDLFQSRGAGLAGSMGRITVLLKER